MSTEPKGSRLFMANNKVTVRLDLNTPQIIAKVHNNRLGLLAATEWKRLIDPYTPRDTGVLQDTAKVAPWTITYSAAAKKSGKSYAGYVYYGTNMNFKKNNPYSTYKWDQAAANAGQVDKLCRTLNAAIKDGKF